MSLALSGLSYSGWMNFAPILIFSFPASSACLYIEQVSQPVGHEGPPQTSPVVLPHHHLVPTVSPYEDNLGTVGGSKDPVG